MLYIDVMFHLRYRALNIDFAFSLVTNAEWLAKLIILTLAHLATDFCRLKLSMFCKIYRWTRTGLASLEDNLKRNEENTLFQLLLCYNILYKFYSHSFCLFGKATFCCETIIPKPVLAT